MKKITKEEELQKVLDGNITIPVYWTQNVDGTRVHIDEENMIDNFTTELRKIVEVVENY